MQRQSIFSFLSILGSNPSVIKPLIVCLFLIPNNRRPIYLSFNVLMAISPRIRAMIQKRTITLGSAQPFNSK